MATIQAAKSAGDIHAVITDLELAEHYAHPPFKALITRVLSDVRSHRNIGELKLVEGIVREALQEAGRSK